MDRFFSLLCCALLLTACAIPVKQIPLKQPLTRSTGAGFTLTGDISTGVGTGYGRVLRKGTRWQEIGTIEHGAVYRSLDQTLTVEGFNVHEAFIVVSGNQLVGFYLPVEKTFTPASSQVALPTQPLEEK